MQFNLNGFRTGDPSRMDSALPADTRRVWLISSNEAPDDFAPLPEGWRELSRQDGGGARARLFVLCNVPSALPEGCR